MHNLRVYRTARLAIDLASPNVGVRSALRSGEVVYYRHGDTKNILADEPSDEAQIAGVTTSRLEANLAEIIERCQVAGARVVLLGYMNSDRVTDVLERVAARAGLPYISTFLARNERSPDLFTADGWHPSAAGHRRTAERLADGIEPLLR